MARRLALGLLAAGGLAAAAWRRRGTVRERVELSFEDGSAISFAPGSSEADALLPLARDVLAAART